MQNLIQVFKQSSWQIIGKIVTTVSTFIILGLVARIYGEAGTGVYTLALTYLAMFYLFLDFGFNAHVLKEVKSQTLSNFQIKQELRKLLGARLAWSVMLTVLAIGLLPLWPFATFEFNLAILLGSAAIIGSGIFVTSNLFFQSQLRYDLSVLASSIGTLTGLGVFTFLSFASFPIPFLLSAQAISWLVIALSALVLINRQIGIIIPIFEINYVKNLFKKSWPIAATLGLNVIYFRADAFILAIFKNISDVGIYNVAFTIFQSVLVLPVFIMNSYYPIMLKSLKEVRLIGIGLLVLSLLATVITLLLAPFFINLLTGGGFLESIGSLQILSLGFPAFFLSSLFMWLLIAKGKYKLMLMLYTSGMIFNLTANYIFIPKYSYIAASWITVISEYFILIMQIMVLWLTRFKK